MRTLYQDATRRGHIAMKQSKLGYYIVQHFPREASILDRPTLTTRYMSREKASRKYLEFKTWLHSKSL